MNDRRRDEDWEGLLNRVQRQELKAVREVVGTKDDSSTS